MKYILSLLLSVVFTLPSFAQGKFALTLSRQLVEDMSQKSLSEFSAKYLVTSPTLYKQIEKALFSGGRQTLPVFLPTLGEGAFDMWVGLSNYLHRAAINKQLSSAMTGGYIPSFAKNSRAFIQQTGFKYSDMAVMLRHALGDPTERNFSGRFVADFKELQLAAIHPTTGQTLDEALRSAYQQATEKKQGILIITEETPEQWVNEEFVPAKLKDMYVMNWQNGQWLSYQRSSMRAFWSAQNKGQGPRGIQYMDELPNGDLFIKYSPAPTGAVIVPANSYRAQQVKYAFEKGYYIQVYVFSSEESSPITDQGKFIILFARKEGDPLFYDAYDLDRKLLSVNNEE